MDGDSTTTTTNYQCTTWHTVVFIAIPLFAVITGAPCRVTATLTAVLDDAFPGGNDAIINYSVILIHAVPFVLTAVVSPVMWRYNAVYVHIACSATLMVALSMLFTSCITVSWQIFFAFTLVNLFGITALNSLTTCLLMDYFPITHRCHVMATAFSSASTAVGNMGLNPLLALLCTHYGWRVGFRMFGVAILVVGMPISLLLRAPADVLSGKEKIVFTDAVTDSVESNFRLHFIDKWSSSSWRSKILMTLWLLTYFLCAMSSFAFGVNIVNYVNNFLGYSLQQASNILIAYNTVYAVIVFLSTGIGDQIRGKLIWALIISDTIALVAAMVFSFANLSHNYIAVMVLVCMFAICDSTFASFMYAASTEITGIDMLTSASATYLSMGVGILISPLIGGMILDNSPQPKAFFYAQSASYVVQNIICICMFLLTPIEYEIQYEEINHNKPF